MKKIIGIFAALLLIASTAFAETAIKVNGSTTVLPIMQKVVEAYMKAHPDVKISVSGGGSGNGIKALIDGATDVAMRRMASGSSTTPATSGTCGRGPSTRIWPWS